MWEVYLRDLALTRARPNVVVFVVSPRDSDDNRPRYDSYLADYLGSRERRALDGDLRALEVIERHAESVSAFMRIRARLREPGRLWQHLTTGSADGWPSIELDASGRTVNFAGRTFDEDHRQRHIDRPEPRPGQLPRRRAAVRCAGAGDRCGTRGRCDAAAR